MNYIKVYSLEVEFEEIDSYRIAHHTKLVAWLERARVRFFDMLGVDLTLGKYSMVLYDLQMKFQKPALFLDKLDVYVAVKEIDGVKLTLSYRICRGKEILSRASTVLSFIDKDTMLVPVPVEIKEKVDRFMDSEKNE